MKTLKHAALALLLVLGLGRPARAEAPKLEVTSTPVKTEVALGENIEVEVQVKNAGTADADLFELTFDARSVSFELGFEDGKQAWDAQFHLDPPRSRMEPYPLAALKKDKLKAGESWKKTFTIPAIAAGSWSIAGVYAGATDPEPHSLGVLDDPARLQKVKDATAKKVKVLPGPNGETEVWAKLTTTMGTITLKFFPRSALGTAINFVRIVKAGDYDSKQFFRISQDLTIIQGGAADASSHYPYSIPREQMLKHKPLAVAMARGGDPNSAGAQFYICYGPLAQALDRPDGYAVFADVVKGKDVVETMASVKINGPGKDGAPATAISLESAKIQLAPKE